MEYVNPTGTFTATDGDDSFVFTIPPTGYGIGAFINAAGGHDTVTVALPVPGPMTFTVDGAYRNDGLYAVASPGAYEPQIVIYGIEAVDFAGSTNTDFFELRIGPSVTGQSVRFDAGDGTDRLSFDFSLQSVDFTFVVAGGSITSSFGTFLGFEQFVLRGGSGNDTITTIGGNDDVQGATGADTISTGAGSDYIYTADGGDTIDGGDGYDAWSGNLSIAGEAVSILVGDVITSSSGTTAYNIESIGIGGGAGNDTFQVTRAINGSLYGGEGFDTISYTAAVATTFQANAASYYNDGRIAASANELGIQDVEQVTFIGSAANDSFSIAGIFTSQQLTFNGGNGTDSLVANLTPATGGLSLAVASDGTISSNFGSFASIEQFNIDAGSGNDAFVTGSGGDFLSGNSGDDTLDSRGGNDFLNGGAGADILLGGDGNDDLRGDAFEASFADHLEGGGGDDMYRRVDAGDMLVENVAGGHDTVEAIVSFVLPPNFEDLILLGTWNVPYGQPLPSVGTGNAENNVITGNEADNVLSGLGGADALYGEDGADQLDGGSGNDLLEGGGGNDILEGGADDDSLNGSSGDDQISGGAGNDTATFATGWWWGGWVGATVDLRISTAQQTGEGNDTLSGIENLTGGSGDDHLTGDDSANVLDGAEGDDTLFGLGGNDELIGGYGNDILDGGSGADILHGGYGNDQFTGGDGDDVIWGEDGRDVYLDGAGADTFYGGAGFDQVHADADGANDLFDAGQDASIYSADRIYYITAAAGIVVDLDSGTAHSRSAADAGIGVDQLVGFNAVTAGNFDDLLIGNASSNMLDAGDGNDTLLGGAGNDDLMGGNGSDQIDGGEGVDTAYFFAVYGGASVDLEITGAQNTGEGLDTLINIENLVGSSYSDQLAGNSGDNIFWSYAGNDILLGRGGDDNLNGGPGDDILDGGSGVDTANYSDAPTGVTVNLSVTGQQDTGGAGLDTLSGIENLFGTMFNDTLTGNSENNVLLGWHDNDVISAAAGDDVIYGGYGSDVLTGGTGADTFVDSAAALNGDTITDLSAEDRIVISDASLSGFTFSLSGTTLSFTGGSLTLTAVPTGTTFVASAVTGGGVQLSLVAVGLPNLGRTGDFNGDGRDDVLWRSDGGALSDWLGQANGGFVTNDANALTNVPTNWSVAGIGDFNGDGRDDVLWRSNSGAVSDWLGQANGGFVANDANAFTNVQTSWSIAGTGDFNGDGRDDVLWRSDSGAVSDWLGQANGGFTANDANAFSNVPTNWHIAGTGDFNGDGRDDILWRSDAGALSDWLGQANGGFVTNDANAFSNVPTNWSVVGTGDFNGDGRDDILWRSGSGAFSDWLGTASGGFITNDANAFRNVPTNWNVQATGDFNGDGRDDIAWRSDSGAFSNWLGQANGAFSTNDANAFSNVPTNWQIQPAEGYWS